MLQLTLKNLIANRIRLALTAFAVVLAVSFVVSSFVLTDGLRSSFNSLSSEIVGGTDYEIRPPVGAGDSDSLDEAALTAVQDVDGVSTAGGVVGADNTILPIKPDGETISLNGPPQLAFGWHDDPRLSSLTLVEGEAPDGPGEFTMDHDSAAANGFVLGETYDIVTPTGNTQATLTGLVSFGEDNATLGATLMQFESNTLQQLLGTEGYSSIVVALEGGVDRAVVEADLAAAAPGAEIVDNATLESETRAEFNSAIGIIGNVLLGFAGISLFVSMFIIYNTFSIVLGQRTKELALLRTVGAEPSQLRRSVLGEAFAIGVFASVVGIAGGVGVALGLEWLFGAIGATLPDTPLIVSARTVAVAVGVGVGMTMVSAVGPARRASRVPPIAALRDGAAAGEASGRTRFVVGALLTATGVIVGAVGLFVAASTVAIISMLALGAMAVFVGVTLLSPLVVRPLTRAMGWPASRVAGVSGTLAKQNAGRNAHRTATTAAALMIGLAMVSMALTVGESVKAQLRSTLQTAVTADYLITSDADLPQTLQADLEATNVVDTVAAIRYDEVVVPSGSEGSESVEVVGADLEKVEQLFDLGIVDGVASDPTVADPVLVSESEATAAGIAVGDQLDPIFANGSQLSLTVIGIFSEAVVIEEPYLIDASTWLDAGANPTTDWLALTLTDGTTIEQADAAFAPIASSNPQLTVGTANDYVRSVEATIDGALTAVNAMVALAVIIALVGIANTLALSVFERTRELGLLRAVGMTRRQLRRMIRLEAGLVALFGAVLGVVIGIGFGWAAVLALPASVTSTLSVPTTRIILLVVVAGAAGLLAAWGPARRASKLDVLDAVAS